MSVRVRFAPSPTGQVHIGNIRAAIFNWLYARHTGGAFLLRIEDTDRERSTPEAIRTLLDVMEWLGMTSDEPPVYQSACTERHLEVAEAMVAAGTAYREDRDGKGECIVCRMPESGRLEFTDAVKGRIRKQAEDLQDFVIVRSDGTPVFHLANVVDDHDMRITHVIRGDDHVENTFKHLQIFRAMGAEPPIYAHLPMIVNHMGKPYSKRDGAAFVGDFQAQGFLPEALFNFLALLGWAPGDDREIMTRGEMVEAFDLDRCKSSAARFDLKKLTWMNGEYLRRLPRETLDAAFRERLAAGGLDPASVTDEVWNAILDLMIPRTKIFGEVPGNCAYFFTDDFAFDPRAVEKRLRPEGTRERLLKVAETFESLPAFTLESTEAALRALGESMATGIGSLVHPVRVAVSGMTEGPGLFEMLVLLGRERVCARLRQAVRMAG
ncbi:MAG: glutamate--tRNA ligase [Lentisphaerae bacterium]|jgi:glutamyl-tRNA synthetase|nr:glutamate--tRNA ligase [Lentisphaerota bacterium]